MAKVIKLSEEMKVDIIKDFAAYMEGIKLMSGTVNFSRAVVSINQKAKIIFKTGAWIKMETLIKNFDKEVAWHGVASRGEGAENVFIISSLFPNISRQTRRRFFRESYWTQSRRSAGCGRREIR